jgi:hypothetical protein
MHFPSLPFNRVSATVIIKRERDRERQRERQRERESINFTYPRDVKATTSQPKYQVVDKNL